MNRFRLWGGWFVLPVIAGAWLGQPNARADDDRITIKLEYAKSIFGGAQPSGVDLSPELPSPEWVLPAARGKQRLFGQIKLGKMNTVNVVLDVLENDEVAMVLTADDDVRFDDKADYRDEDKWQTRIRYADGAEQPYAIRPYYSVAFAKRVGKFRLNFHTACERVGPIKIEGKLEKVKVVDKNNDGDYSDLKQISVIIDYSRLPDYWSIDANSATAPFQIGKAFYMVERITPSGDEITFRPAKLWQYTGTVTDAATSQPIVGAQIVIPRYKLSTMTDQQGAYTLDAPEGELGLLTSQSKNYVPVAHLLSGMDEGEPAPVDLKMDTPTKDLKGTVRLKPLESWHFLAGKRYERTGGDFYFCIHDGVPKFCANAFHQLGLMEVDVGKDVPLDEIPIPKQGFSKSGVEAKEGATYVSRAKSLEDDHFVIFRVVRVNPDEFVELEYSYR